MFFVTPETHTLDLEELERIRFRVDRFLLMPKYEEWMRREAFIRQAYSSTMIENPSISEEERAKAEVELSVDRPDVANYARALEFVDFMSRDQDVVLDELLIRQMHWFLTRGMSDHHYLPGQYRKETNWIEDNGIKVYQPPHQLDIAPLMRELVEALRDDGLHPILKAGVAHVHMVAIHPFVDGNGRTARLLETFVLQSSGWGFRNLLALDSYYQRSRNEYIGALVSTLGSKFPDRYDATSWLDFFCMSVVVQARLLESRLTEWQMMVDNIHRELRPLGLLDRQIDGLVYAARKGEIARRDYIEVTGVSHLTATRDLASMVDKGYLIAEGMGRNRKYRTTSAVLARPVAHEPVGAQQRLP